MGYWHREEGLPWERRWWHRSCDAAQEERQSRWDPRPLGTGRHVREGREQSRASALKKGTRSSRLQEGQCGPVTRTFSLQAEIPEHGGEWRRATGEACDRGMEPGGSWSTRDLLSTAVWPE